MAHRNLNPVIAAALLVAAAACGGGSGGGAGIDVSEVARMDVASSAFRPGEAIPVMHTCDGADVPPPLSWSGAPESARAFAVVVDDPDAPGGTWVHWLVWNIPPGAGEVAAAASGGFAGDAAEGKNSWGSQGYRGPCPPSGKQHRYSFRVYALDGALDLAPGASMDEFEHAAQPHLVAAGEVTGTYRR